MNKPKDTDKTIAVLPFTNMSGNEELEYFSDGITEEITNALARIEQLNVTSRTSSFYFKNKKLPVSQIAKELNVSTILEGSVRLAGQTIRITAQLVDAEKDYHFWSETWDRLFENIFEIQDEISLLVADKLREQYGHFEINEHLLERNTQSIDAYDFLLKARFHFNKWNPVDVRKAIKLYEKVILFDPKHTYSYVGLADAYSFLAVTESMPFLIPNLTLRMLADQLEIHPNKLSWLLNERKGKNFNEFINHYRIQYFKKLALNPENRHISLIGLAYESGFNSKTVFNTYFKKETGMTPKEFLKQNSSTL